MSVLYEPVNFRMRMDLVAVNVQVVNKHQLMDNIPNYRPYSQW